MAKMDSKETAECGFCLRKNEGLRSPKVLLCGHVHCLECLQGFFEVNHVVQCPRPGCRNTYEWNIDNLSAWKNVEQFEPAFCDICTKKNSKNKTAASSFCKSCDQRLCPSHVKWHDEGFDHPKITIEEYRTQAKEREAKSCKKHNKEVDTGCRICRKVMCLSCIYEMSSCDGGRQHQLTSLTDLAACVTQELEGLKDEMVVKEAEVEKMFKDTSRKLSDLDEETEKTLQHLHTTREMQLKAIKSEYALLEREYLKSREIPKSIITEYLEDVVGVRWTELRNERFTMDARLKRTQQVEIISAYPEMSDYMKKVINNEIPKMKVEKSPTLVHAGENRNIELKMDAVLVHTKMDTVVSNTKMDTVVSNAKMDTVVSNTKMDTVVSNTKMDTVVSNTKMDTIVSNTKMDTVVSNTQMDTIVSNTKMDTIVSNTNWQPTKNTNVTSVPQTLKTRQTVVSPIPWSLEVKEKIRTSGKPRSVCVHQRTMHVVMDTKHMVRAEIGKGRPFQASKIFTTHLNSCANYDGKLYVLTDDEPSNILVLDCKTLRVVGKWTHTDIASTWNGISVCSHGVVACDRLNKCVIIYSHTGQEIKRIALPRLGTGWVGACFAGPKAVIISHYDNLEVLKLSVETGEVEWTCYLENETLGVTCYEGDWVLAAGYRTANMAVINNSTGTLIHVTQPVLPRGKVFDLTIGPDDTLIAADFDGQAIISFKMKFNNS